MREQLRDEQWKQIEPMLPGKIGDRGRSGADNRRFVEAVPWIARWSRAGVWHRVFAALVRARSFREVFIDSTIVRAHRHAAGAPRKNGAQALGRSRGGLTTTIHVVVDAIGRLIQGRRSAGQADGLERTCAISMTRTISWASD